MKTAKRHNVRSQLVRRLAGALEVPWLFWGLALGLGCAVFLSAGFLYPLWILVKPRPSAVAQPLLNTPLEPLAPWVAFLLLYVPDMVLLFASGLLAGFCVRRSWLRWLSTCVAAYTVLSVAFGGAIWHRAVVAAIHVNLLDLRYGVLCLVIVSAAYAGALVAIRLRSPDHPCGSCPKCGYSLYGLPSAVCPECGRPFSPSEAENDADGGSKAPDRLSIEHSNWPSPHIWIARRALLLRVCAMGVLLSLFYGLDWMSFRVAQRDAIGWSLRVAGYAPEAFVHEGSPAVRVRDHVFFYTAECTYLDLLMIVTPLLWVFGASLWRNICRIAIAALVILGGNLIRTWASVYFNVRGTDWFYTHDLPDYLIWWPTVVVVALLALRRDFGDRFISSAGSSAGSERS